MDSHKTVLAVVDKQPSHFDYFFRASLFNPSIFSMVSLLWKKSPGNQSIGPPPKGSGNSKNQLVHAVSPFDECLPTSDSFCFKKGFKMIRRKHSAQRDQLNKLKAQEILKSTVQHMNDSDVGPAIENRLMTGLLPTPARSQASVPPHHFLSKPVQLRHKGTQQASVLATATMSMAKETNGESEGDSTGGQKKYPAQIFRPPSCYGGPYPMVPTTGDHEIPFVISISQLKDPEEDASSDISLEDTAVYTSTATTASTLEHSTVTEITATSVGGWPSYPVAADMPMRADIDLQYSGSSISWPSDEDDDGETIGTDTDDDVELDRSSLQLITEVRELNCTDDVGSQIFKADLGCGGFWSDGMVHKGKLKSEFKGFGEASSAGKEEENCRDDTSGNKTREETSHRLGNF